MTSLDFTWNKGAKASGTVFTRKRNFTRNWTTINTQLKPAEIFRPEIRLKKQSDDFQKQFEKSLSQGTQGAESSGQLVRRKKKKDKLAVKAKSVLQDDKYDKETDHGFNRESNGSHSLFSVRPKDIYVDTDILGMSVVEKVFSIGKKFSDLEIHRHLVSNLEKNGFSKLTKVQEKAIPVITEGKNALIRSQTGSGKTLAYVVPIINALQSINPRITRNDGVQALIVVPTRELVLQIHELFGKINTFQWIVAGHLCGGENRKTEKHRLRKGVHVLMGTPGRLLDHISHTCAFKIQNVRCLVLDEADRLLDMGFKKDIVKIVEELDKSKANAEYDPISMLKGQKLECEVVSDDIPPLKNPKSKSRQTILLSATLNEGISELATFTMKDHMYIDSLDDGVKINPEHMVIPNTVKQKFVMTYAKHRLFTLSAILLSKAKHKVFVFMATTHMVNYHYELFTKYLAKMPINRRKLRIGQVALSENEDSEDEEEVVLEAQFFKLHGNMDQNDRKAVFTAFRAAKNGILLCTDVAARGVDVPEADSIIQYTGPQTDEDYLHRVGRTGRAGKSGSALIFLTHEEQEYISRLQDHKVFLKKLDPNDFLGQLCILMEEPDQENACVALQRRYETALAKDKELHKMACLAYSSWSRFYNTYPAKLRSIFNFKNVNLGHYVTSFGLRETPSSVSKIVRGQVAPIQPKKFNKKLATHSNQEREYKTSQQKRKIKSVSLTTSEFASGLEPTKKKKKKNKTCLS